MFLRQKWRTLVAHLAITQLAAGSPAGDPPSSYPPTAPLPKLGAVASESSICSKIGTQLLQSGGNAADALVGTVFCIGVVAMYHSGIGGGGFMIVRSTTGVYEFIDFRETAPAAASENMYQNDTDASLYGGLARSDPNKK
jgi:gamma-glutamyltranspeptidase/glutathione hydrolase